MGDVASPSAVTSSADSALAPQSIPRSAEPADTASDSTRQTERTNISEASATIDRNDDKPVADVQSGVENIKLHEDGEMRNKDSTQKVARGDQDKPQQAPKNSDKFIPFFREYTLINEYKLLRDNSPPGMYVIPSTETTQIWHGVLFVREGSYEGAIFKFDVYIPNNFPTEQVPTIQFTSDVFHPAVDAKTGLVSLDRKWDKWIPHQNHLYNLLADLQGMFINLDVEKYTQANEDAYNILMNDQQLFKIKVRQRVEHSIAHVYTTRDGKGSIQFEEYRNDVHGPVLQNILQNKWRSSVQNASLGVSDVRRPPT